MLIYSPLGTVERRGKRLTHNRHYDQGQQPQVIVRIPLQHIRRPLVILPSAYRPNSKYIERRRKYQREDRRRPRRRLLEHQRDDRQHDADERRHDRRELRTPAKGRSEEEAVAS